MAVPLVILKPNSSRNRSGPIVPTVSGAVPITTLDNAPAWVVEEGTTNLFPNPLAVSTGSATWVTATATGAYVTGRPEWSHGTAYRAETSGAFNSGIQTSASFGADGHGTYTVSASVVSGDNVVRVWVRAHYTTGDPQDSALPTLTLSGTGPHDIVVGTITTDPERTLTGIQAMIRAGNTAIKEIAATNLQIEKSPYATSFCPAYKDGILQEGNVWNGTPHASTSTRIAGAVDAPMPEDVRVSPSLLLSPDGSFDRNGPVSPTTGLSTQVVAGQYGNAWRGPEPNSRAQSVRYTFEWAANYTLIYRVLLETSVASMSAMTSNSRSVTANTFRNNGNILNVGFFPTNVWMTLAMRVSSNVLSGFRDGVLLGNMATSLDTSTDIELARYGPGTTIEAALVYPTALPDAEIARISVMPAAWTMTNATANISGVWYVRYDEGDGMQSTVITDAGPIGNYGYLGGSPFLAATRPVNIAAVVGYDRPLTDRELAKLDATPTSMLGWETLMPSNQDNPPQVTDMDAWIQQFIIYSGGGRPF